MKEKEAQDRPRRKGDGTMHRQQGVGHGIITGYNTPWAHGPANCVLFVFSVDAEIAIRYGTENTCFGMV